MSALKLVYQPQHLKRWEYPQNYSGASFNDYYRTGIGQSRDSECIERANFAAMLEKLGGESETVVVSRCGHWAVGWVEAIYIHESDTDKLKLADAIMADFEEYPVVDDDTLSKVEADELQSTIDSYQDEFRSTVCKLLGQDFSELTKREQQEVDSFIQNCMQEDSGYRGVDEAFVTEESIERAVEQSKYWCGYKCEQNNLVAFLQAAFNVEGA